MLAFGSLVLLGWQDNARGPLYPMILEGLKLNHFKGGMFFAVASFVAVLANFLVPVLLKKMSSLRTLLVGIAFMIGFSFGFSFSQGFWTLILSAVSFGMSLGIVMVTINIVIEDFVPPLRQRALFSIMHSLYGLSAFLAPVLVGYILDWPLSWEQAFLPVLFISIPLLFYGIWQELRLKQRLKQTGESVVRLTTPALAPSERKHILIFWSLILACYVSSELYFSTRLAVIYQEGFSVSVELSRRLLSFFFLGLFVGRVFNSFVPVRIPGRWIIFSSLLSSTVWILLCISFEPKWIWFVGFLMAPVFPVAMSEISSQSKTEFKKISSLCIAGSSFVVVWMHMMAGGVADIWGLHASLYIPVGFLLIALIAILGFWPKLLKAS